jgi:hypothetical protein
MSGVKKPSSVANGSAWRQVKEMTIRTPDVLRKRGPHEAALWKASGCYGKLVQRTPDCRSMARAKYLSERRFRNVHAEILIFGVFPKDRHGLPSRWRTCSRIRAGAEVHSVLMVNASWTTTDDPVGIFYGEE